MDFGGGDGYLSAKIAAIFPEANIYCYEPSPELFKQAKERISGAEKIKLINSLADIAGMRFDYVFCLEVFEHLPCRQLEEALISIETFVAKDGLIIACVPNEIFFPAFVKGLFRMLRRYGEYDTQPLNILKAAVGRAPTDRPVSELAPGLDYHFHHLGFDYRKLHETLLKRFRIERVFGSPFGCLGRAFNFSICFIMRKVSGPEIWPEQCQHG